MYIQLLICVTLHCTAVLLFRLVFGADHLSEVLHINPFIV